jgi:hypothetical protein
LADVLSISSVFVCTPNDIVDIVLKGSRNYFWDFFISPTPLDNV